MNPAAATVSVALKSIACLAALALLVPSARAEVTIFSHTFDEGDGGLDGTPVDTGTGSWVAFNGVNADGEFNPLPTTAPAGAGSATLAFSPSSGFAYQLDARITDVVGTGDWVAFGFANGQSASTGQNHRFITAGGAANPGPVGTAWMLFRGDNTTNTNMTFLGTGILSAGSQGNLNGEPWPSLNNSGGSIDLRIVLDATGGSGNWTASWLAKNIGDPEYTVLREEEAIPVADESRYTSVGFAFSSGAIDGTLESFSLAVIATETILPQLVSVSPDSTDVWIGTSLVATFDEPVQAGSSGTIEIRRSSDSELVESFDVTSSPQLVFEGSTLTINPSSEFDRGVEYYVLISATAITDLVGNEFEGISDPEEWSFTTDNTPPVSIGMGPMTGDTDVSPLASLILDFNEPIQAGTGTLTIHLASDGSVVQTIEVTSGMVVINGSSVTINPGQLDELTAYYVTVSFGAFTDLSGNAYVGFSDSTTWTFTTGSIPVGLLFSHAFGGDSSDLNGTTPDVTTGGANWVAASVFNQDGTTDDGVGSATLAFTPYNGLVYTLEASYSGLSAAVPGDIDWFGMGFANGQSELSNTSSRFIRGNVVGGPWMMVRGDFSLDTNQSFLGNGQLGGGDNGLGPGGDNNGVPWSLDPTEDAVDFRIILDTSGGPGMWTATWFAKNSSASTYTEVRPTEVLYDPTTITSVGLARSGPGVSGTVVSFQLYTGMPADGEPLVLKISTSGGALDFEWNSMNGMQYDLVTSTDLSTPVSTWPPYDDGVEVYENIPASGTGTNTLTGVVKLGPQRFFALIEEPIPPLLTEDFEAVTPPGLPDGWSATDNGAGTVWTVGDPNGTGTEPKPEDSSRCAGTNMNGNYTANAEASLVTRVFTVPPSGATLRFRQYIDTEVASGGGDFGSVRLLNADGSVLAGGDVLTDLQGISETWTNQAVALPAVANGLDVRLEFGFTSNETQHFAGFYIDDVLVTAN